MELFRRVSRSSRSFTELFRRDATERPPPRTQAVDGPNVDVPQISLTPHIPFPFNGPNVDSEGQPTHNLSGGLQRAGKGVGTGKKGTRSLGSEMKNVHGQEERKGSEA